MVDTLFIIDADFLEITGQIIESNQAWSIELFTFALNGQIHNFKGLASEIHLAEIDLLVPCSLPELVLYFEAWDYESISPNSRPSVFWRNIHYPLRYDYVDLEHFRFFRLK